MSGKANVTRSTKRLYAGSANRDSSTDAHARARKSPQSKPSSDFLLTSTPASAATERTADRLGRFACEVVGFTDRRCGSFSENLERDVGDFVIKRADGLWAYQLAVVVDDAEQGITDVVRGEDLLDNTPRQIFLQRKLGYPTPQYLHIALALDGHGQKLSKQTHAPAIDNEDPLELLNAAAIHLGLGSLNAKTPQAFYAAAQEYWAEKYLY